MPCRFGSRLNPDGSEVRFIACTRGAPPPCPFPADPGPDPVRGSSDATPHPFRPGAPFRSARHGAGTVLGPVLGEAGRIAVRFAGGRVVSYDLATLPAARPPSPDSGALPFG
jgi:hypothetical protein